MSLYLKNVSEFHKTFQHPVANEPQNNIFTEKPDRVKLRLALVLEEIEELQDAVYEKKYTYPIDHTETEKMSRFIEVVDACADIVYVVAGMAIEFGLDFSTQVDSSHAKPLMQYDKEADIREDFESIYYNPVSTWDTLVEYKTICDKYNEIENLCENKTIEGISEKLGEIVIACRNYLQYFGICLNTMFNEVHRSNMTKASPTEEDAKASVEKIKKEGRYKEPYYEKSECGKFFILKDRTNGKILKDHKYEEPRLVTKISEAFAKTAIMKKQFADFCRGDTNFIAPDWDNY